MARNDQAHWSTLVSEGAPDRWRTKGREPPFAAGDAGCFRSQVHD